MNLIRLNIKKLTKSEKEKPKAIIIINLNNQEFINNYIQRIMSDEKEKRQGKAIK